MKRRYDIVHVVALLLFLVIANFIGNAIIKGILLLLFSSGLIVNTAFKLKDKISDKSGSRFFYGVLLFLDIVLAIGAIAVIVSAILGA